MIDDEPDEHVNKAKYQRGSRCLQWLVSKTQPDIAHAACLLAQYKSTRTKKCWNALMHVIHYLQGPKGHRLCYQQKDDRRQLPDNVALLATQIPIGPA